METSEKPWISTVSALSTFPYHLATTNLLELRKCKIMLYYIFNLLTFEIQTSWRKHLNDTLNGWMSPRGSYIEVKNGVNSFFVSFMIINVSIFFILIVNVLLTLSYCETNIFVIDSWCTFPLISYSSSEEFCSSLCKVKLACDNWSLHFI